MKSMKPISQERQMKQMIKIITIQMKTFYLKKNQEKN